MNLTIRTHHTSLFDDFEPHAAERLARLERWLPRVDDVVVEVEHEETRAAAHRYAVQVTVRSGSSVLRAEERAADPRVALDAAADVLSRQARRHKKRLHDRHLPAKEMVADALNASAPPPGPPEPDEEEEYVLGKIVRVKHFTAKPISQEEALAQMDLLGHDFYLFLDEATDDYAVLYKRDDGDHGLLSPRRG
ncbi:MAG: ribosome-associated translation inhibitor RaiA [Chloroflexi bacterium]|nr:ribosome-associated translation inhibitor RaiA [Chloroflexota bacterium]